jgi:hypothetical protein
VRVVLQCGIAVYLLSRATLPDMLLSWCTHRPSSPSTLRLHSKTGTAGSNVNGLLLRSFELLLQARMATKAAAASPGRDRAPASTSEGRPAAGTARVDQGRQARRPPANRHEAAKNQQKHRPTKQRTPQGCVVESAAVVPPDPAEGWKEEPPERVARKKTPPERNASGKRKHRRGWNWRRRRRRRRGQSEGLWHEEEGLPFVLGVVVVVVVVSVGLFADGSMGGIGLELTCC